MRHPGAVKPDVADCDRHGLYLHRPAERAGWSLSTKRPKSPLSKRILPAILRRLALLGLRLRPFLLVREGVEQRRPDRSGERFQFGPVTADDIDELLRLESKPARDALERWFAEGKLCHGVRDGAKLVAKTWSDLAEFNYPPAYRRLEVDEAYLFAAYIDPAYRGHNLAPFMRALCYAELRALGRTRLWSYTDYYNASARRFKTKLGAVDEALCLHIDLFGKWSKTLTLRHYR